MKQYVQIKFWNSKLKTCLIKILLAKKNENGSKTYREYLIFINILNILLEGWTNCCTNAALHNQ
jgi:hypothetical protein